jgi:hypothetical protein
VSDIDHRLVEMVARAIFLAKNGKTAPKRLNQNYWFSITYEPMARAAISAYEEEKARPTVEENRFAGRADLRLYRELLGGMTRREIAEKHNLSYGGVCNRIRTMAFYHERGLLDGLI